MDEINGEPHLRRLVTKQSDDIMGKTTTIASPMLEAEVLAKMTDDQTTTIIKNDPLLLELDNNALKKNIKNTLRRGGYAGAKMRLSASLLLELRKILNSNMCTFDAVKRVAGEQSDGCEDSFTHPANALRLGQHIKGRKGRKRRIAEYWQMCVPTIGQKTYPLSHWKQ